MRQTDAKRTTRRQAYQLVMLQALVVVVISLLFCFGSAHAAWSVALGGFCSVIPSALYTVWLFRDMNATKAHKIVAIFYVGEFGKLAIAVVLALLCLLTLKVVVLPFFIGFLVAQFAFLLAPIFGLFK